MTAVLTTWHFLGGSMLLALMAGVLSVLFIPSFKGARTRAVNWYGVIGIGGIIPILAEFTDYLQVFDWTTYVSPKAAPLILISVGLLQIILRRATNTPPKTMTKATKDTVRVVVKSTTK